MQQYFVNFKFENKNFDLSKDDSFHIEKVMRKKINDKIYVVFSDEKKYICNILEIKNNIVTVIPFEEVKNTNELDVNITIAIPPLKGEKLDYLLQKSTELGVKNIVLFNSERNISKIKENKIESKLERYSKILKEASEQSKRNFIPKIFYKNNIGKVIENFQDFDYKIIAHENESNNFDNNNLKELLLSKLTNKNVICIFGSEGGLSEKEVKIFEEKNYKKIGLGKRILRAETAPLYFLSCLAYFSELN